MTSKTIILLFRGFFNITAIQVNVTDLGKILLILF